jgi:hypothetical protein
VKNLIVGFLAVYMLLPGKGFDFGTRTFEKDIPVQAHVVLENRGDEVYFVEMDSVELNRVFDEAWSQCVDLDGCDPYSEKGFITPDEEHPFIRLIFMFEREEL